MGACCSKPGEAGVAADASTSSGVAVKGRPPGEAVLGPTGSLSVMEASQGAERSLASEFAQTNTDVVKGLVKDAALAERATSPHASNQGQGEATVCMQHGEGP